MVDHYAAFKKEIELVENMFKPKPVIFETVEPKPIAEENTGFSDLLSDLNVLSESVEDLLRSAKIIDTEKPLDTRLLESMPKDCWVRNVATKRKGREYWVDSSDESRIYIWDRLHEDHPSAHVEVYVVRDGTKYAYLLEEVDPFNSSKAREVPKRKMGRRIEL